MRSPRVLASILALGILAAGLSACTEAATSSIEPAERTIYMAAVEPKGGQTVDKEPFPETALPEGGGYVLKEPNDEDRWEVSTYRWEPGTIVVTEGDLVTLEIIGINGAEHSFTIEGYDVSGLVTRGNLTTVSFTADKAGIFKIVCASHMPSMQADLVVLPAA